MARDEQEWIRDILTAIADIRADTLGSDFAAFSVKPAVIRSVLYSIGIIGEATKHISDGLKARHPEIPWRAVASMRDRVVHEYFRTNIRRVWDVVTEDLDPLEASLQDAPEASGD